MTTLQNGDLVKRADGGLFNDGKLVKYVITVDDRRIFVADTLDAPVNTQEMFFISELELARRCIVNKNSTDDPLKGVLPTTKPVAAPYAFKADQGKPRWSLLMDGCANAIAGVVRVLTFAVTPVDQGGKGYKPHSWKEVPNAKERYRDALHRHLNKIALGETHDDESKELHWHHVATNALFLAELEVKGDSK